MNQPLEQYSAMSVLIIDDEPANVELLRQLLTNKGLGRVHTETDSRQVTHQLLELRPDLVLLDLHMPHLDGFEVLAEIRRFAAGSYLPVLVLTADTTTAARNRALTEGAQDFLTKPIDAMEAVLRVANLLQTRELYTTLRRGASSADVAAEAALHVQAQCLDRIRGIIRDQAITPVFQPVVDLVTLEAVGHEGLSRFPDPDHGGPDRWFTEAFNVGLGVELEWLAARLMLDYFDTAPPEAYLAINMSPATILHVADNRLCDPVLWPRIVIEVTEHVPVEDYAALHRALAEMRSHGTRLSADDLGSGYAGFRHLIRLDADIIKLDISLVAGIHRSHEQRALVRALVSFAAEIGADVVAEGIEEPDELTALQDVGVAYGQGYLLGRPAPLASQAP